MNEEATFATFFLFDSALLSQEVASGHSDSFTGQGKSELLHLGNPSVLASGSESVANGKRYRGPKE